MTPIFNKPALGSAYVRTTEAIEKFISSRLFLVLTFLLFIFQSVYMSFSTKVGVPPDEDYHLGLIRLFTHNGWLPFIHDQAGSYYLGEVQHTPFFIYEYILSLPNHFLGEGQVSVLVLRLLNVMMAAGSLWVMYKIALKLKISAAARNLAVFLLSTTLMFVFLSSSINYDNLLILLSLSCVYLLLTLYDKITLPKLELMLIFLILGSLTVVNFLPVGFILAVLLAILLFRQRSSLKKNLYLSFRRSRKACYVLGVILIVVLALFSQRYLYNIAKYHTYAPSCTKTMTLNQCKQNHIFARSIRINSTVRPKATKTVPNYIMSWAELMDMRIFGIFSHKSILPTSAVVIASEIFVLLGLIFAIRFYNRKNRLINSVIVISVFYTLVLILNNYLTYQRYGSFSFAVQGRYLFPVLPLIFLLLCFYTWKAPYPRLRSIYVVVLILIFTVSCLPAYIYKTGPEWHTTESSRLNSSLKNLMVNITH